MSQVLAQHHIHDLHPVLIQFTEKIAIRWYGLAYIAGFVLGYLVLRWLARRLLTEVPASKLSDFITYAAIFGILIGGRLGYLLFYRIGDFMANPLIFFRIMDGGMSSHGGILGMVLFTAWYARRHKLSWTGIGDDFVIGAPIGLFCGRVANYINGELYGRIAPDVSWAVKFPTEVHDPRFVPADPTLYSFPYRALPHTSRESVELAKTDPAVANFLEHGLNPRHPSQLYEAFAEGLLLFLILLGIRLLFPRLRHGILTGTFFILYAVGRIICERFREPDHGIDAILGMTRGQFYSTFMIVAGIAFIVWALVRGKPVIRSEKPEFKKPDKPDSPAES